MRILYVNQTAQVSGAERSLLSLLKGLERDPEPLVGCPPGELAEVVREMGIEVAPIVGTQASFRLHPIHTSRGLAEMARSSLQVRHLASSFAADLVHANTSRASLLALLARRRSGPPVLAHIRDWVPEGRFSRFVLGVIARRADMVVANSAYVARQFDGLPLRQPVRVVHNPVDLERFDPASADGSAVRRELGVPGDALVLAVVAQLTPWKGQDDAIRAFAALPASDRETILLLVGSAKFAGPGTQFDNVAFEGRLRRLATELGVAERVRFAGERSDIPDVLAATDVLLMPSWREAFGRIAIEAMAMGVPVAATDVGGPAEIVRPDIDGLLLPPRDPVAWSRGLGPLLEDARKREEMGERGLARAGDFSLAAHAAAIRALYEDLLGVPQ
jgi:glycosyltransferase involved in cell wall biosynthesis